MKKKVTKLLIWIIIALLVIFLGWRVAEVIGKSRSEAARGFGGAVAVEISAVRRESIKEVRNFSGSIEAAYSYPVASKVSGRLISLLKNVGDYVQENEIIAYLDDAEYQQALLEAKANLSSAQANLKDAESQLAIAERNLKQAESLHKQDFISELELEKEKAAFISAQTKLELAKAQLQQRETSLRLAEIRLEYTVLRASKAGYIGQRFSDEGSLLSINSPVVSIVGIDDVIVRSNLVERIYGRIEIGMPANVITDAFPGQIYSGKVLRIAPVLNEQTRMAEMEIRIPNTSHQLKPGMFCRLNIVLSERENTQTVPAGAILRDNDQHGIFVVDEAENVARYIPVQMGIANETRTEILAPEIDKPVITLGQYQVKDGSKVLISNQPKKSGK